MKKIFGSKELSPTEETHLKNNFFDITMNPREWMARFGHKILLGDFRMFQIQDKIFETWINEAFEALHTEGLEKLWEEFLNTDEILIVREKFNNP